MASIDMMHQIPTNITPDKDSLAKMTIPNGLAQEGVLPMDDVAKDQLKGKITEQVTNEMLNNQIT